jgi:aspartate ammonia-lyase
MRNHRPAKAPSGPGGRFRVEKDSLGERRVPADAYYGAQTSRAIENYPVSGLRFHPLFISTYVQIKKACALVHAAAGALDAVRKNAIVRACDEILAGKLGDPFVVDVYQMGAGTATHMNVNEVIANRANELLGGRKGVYDRVHPNDHVNMGQSTNDTFPAAVRLSAALMIRRYLEGPLDRLADVLVRKGREFDRVLKSARTHLQDAVPIRLGQEFAAYGAAVRRSRHAIARAAEGLLETGLGGSAAGTGINTRAGFPRDIAARLGGLLGLKVVPARDLCEAMQSQQPVARVSAELRILALEITRISNDLRLLSSGPTTGLAEILLPETAPGSSIMPGKVNPSILEMTNMVAYQVIGCDAVVAMAVQAGQLELNVMMPVMSYNLNFAIEIFGNALGILAERCVKGIRADAERCRRYAERSMGLATALNPYIGYARAAEVAKEALRSGKTLIEVIREKRLLSEAQIRRVMDPVSMTAPGGRARAAAAPKRAAR